MIVKGKEAVSRVSWIAVNDRLSSVFNFTGPANETNAEKSQCSNIPLVKVGVYKVDRW